MPEGIALIIMDSGPGVIRFQEQNLLQDIRRQEGIWSSTLHFEILDITGGSHQETGTYGEGARFEAYLSTRCLQV